MKISTLTIQSLNPCGNRFNNYLQHYSDFNGDIKDFVMLENITYNDKIWVITKLFNKEQNVKFAIMCASSVLSIFESNYPGDNRPRKALEAAENWLLNPTEKNRIAAATAATNAVNAAYAAAAIKAPAATAVKAAAYVSADAYAAYAAAYAAKSTAVYSTAATADAAYSAAYTAAVAAAYAADKNRQQQVNLLFAVEVAERPLDI